MRRILWLVAALVVLVGCARQEEPAVVGCWVTQAAEDYYFQLYDDGTCMMFNAADEWVSSGTYTVSDKVITFETDTGSFVWVEDPDEEGTMLFEAGDTVFRYRLQK